jgi:hypothetical protein
MLQDVRLALDERAYGLGGMQATCKHIG